MMKQRDWRRTMLEYMGIKMRSSIEVKFAHELEMRRRAGEIESWQYEPVVLDLCPNINGLHYKNGSPKRSYKPDFVAFPVARNAEIFSNKPTIYEIKGSIGRCHKCGAINTMRAEKGIIKFEAAANLYHADYKFILVTFDGKKTTCKEMM